MTDQSSVSFQVYEEKGNDNCVSIRTLEDIVNHIHPDDLEGDFLEALIYNLKLNYTLSIDENWTYSPLIWSFDDETPSEISDDNTDFIKKLDFFQIDESEKERIIKEFNEQNQ